jgi:phosphonate transport system substrate-binding protein
VFSNPRTSLASTWLETRLSKEGLGRLSDVFDRVTQFSKLTRAILPVYFGQIDACLVTRQGFETASELNPQVGRQLKVLASSEALVPVVFCFRGDYKSPYRDRLLAEIGKVKTTAAGQQFMTLFQCDTLMEGPESLLASASALLQAHRDLRGETNRSPGSIASAFAKGGEKGIDETDGKAIENP